MPTERGVLPAAFHFIVPHLAHSALLPFLKSGEMEAQGDKVTELRIHGQEVGFRLKPLISPLALQTSVTVAAIYHVLALPHSPAGLPGSTLNSCVIYRPV